MNPLVPNAFELVFFIIIPLLVTVGLAVFLFAALRRNNSKPYNKQDDDSSEADQ